MLSDDREETEATDRGRDAEGMVKDRTMDRGRLPRRSSRLEGCRGGTEREARWMFVAMGFRSGGVRVLDHVVLTAWNLDPNCQHLYVQHMLPLGVKDENEDDLVLENFRCRFIFVFTFIFFFYQDHDPSASSKVLAESTDQKAWLTG